MKRPRVAAGKRKGREPSGRIVVTESSDGAGPPARDAGRPVAGGTELGAALGMWGAGGGRAYGAFGGATTTGSPSRCLLMR